MKIVIAPDSFKGSLSSILVADAIGQSFRKIIPGSEIIKMPMADGGEGTVECMVGATGGKIFREFATDPLGKVINAHFGVLGDEDTVIIEMASASGIILVPGEKRNPLYTTTYGTGELIRKVLEKGYKKIILGLGGSATTDGGAGAMQALGVKLLDSAGVNIKQGGVFLKDLEKIDTSEVNKNLQKAEITFMYDVENPLLGEKGAAKVYSPQKGASAKEVQILEENLTHFSRIIKRDIGKDISDIPGSGAAGGLGAGLSAICNSKFIPGIQLAIKVTGLKRHLKNADMIITGEGELNFQSMFGKVPAGVAKLAKEMKVPAICFAGNIERNSEKLYKDYFKKIICLVSSDISKEDAIKNASLILSSKAEEAALLFKKGVLFET